MWLSHVEALREMLFVNLCDAVILPSLKIQEDIVYGLLQRLEFRFVNKVRGNLLWQDIQEHGFEVFVWETTAMLIFNSLPGTNPSEHKVRPRALRESVEGPDPLKSHF